MPEPLSNRNDEGAVSEPTLETTPALDPYTEDSSETFWSAQDHSGAMPESQVVQQDEVEEQDNGINKDDNRSYPGEDMEPEPSEQVFSTPEKGSSVPRRRSASRCRPMKTFSKPNPYWSDCLYVESLLTIWRVHKEMIYGSIV